MNIAILGGGIGGLCTAIGLQRSGYDVTVYEGASELRALGAGLALSANAMLALRQLKLEESVKSVGHAFDQVTLLDQRGKTISTTDMDSVAAAYGAGNFSVHRADLQRVLVNQLNHSTLQLGKRCTEVIRGNQQVELRFEDGTEVAVAGLIAFDGIHSVVRKMLLPQTTLRYAGYTCWRAVIPYKFHHHAKRFSETWGTRGRFGIVPLINQRVYWFATMSARRNDPQLRDYKVADLLNNFQDYHVPISDIIANTSDEQLLWNDILDFKPIEHYAFDNVVLAGDAAHAMTPNMGQGAGMAIEDAAVLVNCLTGHRTINEAFHHFEQRRKKRVSSIVNGAFRLGQVAQLRNSWLGALRNGLLRILPERISQQQMDSLYRVNLEL